MATLGHVTWLTGLPHCPVMSAPVGLSARELQEEELKVALQEINSSKPNLLFKWIKLKSNGTDESALAFSRVKQFINSVKNLKPPVRTQIAVNGWPPRSSKMSLANRSTLKRK
ncbi:unnamed protein product [Cyprideis torosa]|uniref:Uncharacterized protein n=1 Tax=Cyprideis torosa TaxID=163714 RepID=A0A7R8W809_9CRUS|nr:unnamed protein product [Cyprideis torosa]CAG0888111.1 unnamed protein product [Cyprideis torosa]